MKLSCQSIRRRCLNSPLPLITPFHERSTFHREVPRTGGQPPNEGGVFTYGLGPAGYDVRVEFGPGVNEVVIPPGGFQLASTMEQFHMPRDLVGEVKDKSSWARRGLAVQNTVIEPGWRGFLTLELTNHSHRRIYIPAGAPIAQILFELTDEPVEWSYEGKYQDQPRGPQQAI